MPTLTDTSEREVRVAHGHPHRRRIVAVVGAMAGAVVLAVVLTIIAVSGPGPSKHANPPARAATQTNVNGVASWFAAATGGTCTLQVPPQDLPGVSKAIVCHPEPDITAEFARFPSTAAPIQYLADQARSQSGSALRAWKGTGALDQGDALFFGSATNPTFIWTYDGQPFLGWATSSSSLTSLQKWWTTNGREVRPRLVYREPQQ